MKREYAIELLKRMKRRAMTDDYETTRRVAEEHEAIDLAIRDITWVSKLISDDPDTEKNGDTIVIEGDHFIKRIWFNGKLQKFGRWKRIPAGMTPGGTPMYACAQCGGTEHLQGAEYPGRKVLCDDCGCVNFYPWDKLADWIIPGETEVEDG